MKKQSSIIKEQNAKLQVQATRLENHEITISEMKKKFEELQNNFVEMKSKWEIDIHKKTNVSATLDLNKKDAPVDANSITKNLRKIIQQESVRQKHDILKKICGRVSDTRTITNKPQLSNLHRHEARKKCMSMVDMEIWRRRCPTSRSTYSLWYKNNIKNRAEILLSKNPASIESHQPETDRTKTPKKSSDFIYKSVTKPRASKIFPLTYLDLERKRKSHLCSDIPSKLMKTNTNNSVKALDLINKYPPGPKQIPEDENNSLSSNILSYLQIHPNKHKRNNDEYV